MRTGRACPESIVISAQVGTRQVKHLASPLIILPNLLFSFSRAPRELAMRVAGLSDAAHHCLKCRVVELQVYSQTRTEIGVAIGDHINTLDGGNGFDILQPFQ